MPPHPYSGVPPSGRRALLQDVVCPVPKWTDVSHSLGPSPALSTVPGICLSDPRTSCCIPHSKDSLHAMRVTCTAAPRLPECAPSAELAGSTRPSTGGPSARSALPRFLHLASRLLALTNSAPGPPPGTLSLRPHLLQGQHLSLSLSGGMWSCPQRPHSLQQGEQAFSVKARELIFGGLRVRASLGWLLLSAVVEQKQPLAGSQRTGVIVFR